MDLEGDVSSVSLFHLPTVIPLTASFKSADSLIHPEIYKVFKHFGPTPRIVNCFRDPHWLAQYKGGVEAISDPIPDKFRSIAMEAMNLSSGNNEDILDKLCLFRRSDNDRVESKHIVVPITEFIK